MGGAYVSQALGKTGTIMRQCILTCQPASSIFAASQIHKGVGWCEKGVKVRMDHHQLDVIWLN